MTNEQRVREVYPDVTVTHCAHVWEIWESESTEGDYSHRLGHSAQSLVLAFSDAASRLPKAEVVPQMERWAVHYDSMPHTCLYPQSCDCNCEGCVKARGFKVEVLNGRCACGHVDCPHCSRRIASRVMQKAPESQPQTFEEWWATRSPPQIVGSLVGWCKAYAVAAWNAAKASSPAVAGGESEYQRGFDDCREKDMRIFDEHEGFLSRIETLGDAEQYPEPLREEGKHRFMAGTCVDCGRPLDEVCAANLGIKDVRGKE